MDQVVNERARHDDRLAQIASALEGGLVFVDSDGTVLWVDEKTRQQANGALQHLTVPGRLPAECAVDGRISTVNLPIDGSDRRLCVVQIAAERGTQGTHDVLAAMEAAMSDSSWLTRMLMERLKAWLQASRPAANSSDLEALTDREREILALICEGRSDLEMSRMLHLSHNTVRNHVASLYRKIGVNRRSAAIIWARERAITSREALAVKSPSRKRVHPERRAE